MRHRKRCGIDRSLLSEFVHLWRGRPGSGTTTEPSADGGYDNIDEYFMYFQIDSEVKTAMGY